MKDSPPLCERLAGLVKAGFFYLNPEPPMIKALFPVTLAQLSQANSLKGVNPADPDGLTVAF